MFARPAKANKPKDTDLLYLRARARAEAMRLRARENPFRVIREGRLKIKTKAGLYKRFVPNPIQTKLLDQLEQDWRAGRPIRYLILKARQEGVSTLIEAVLYCLTALQDNQNSLILADDIKGANYLFDMSRLYQDSMKESYPWMVPNLIKDNARGLKFEKIRSQIIIESGDNKEAGRKYTFRIVHISEAAFIPFLSEILTGLLQAVPDLEYTLVVLETTANGVGGCFYELWNMPETGYDLWRKIFFAWYDNPEYSRPFTQPGEATSLKKNLGTDPRFNEYEGEEAELRDKYKCDLEQLNWRRWAIINKCGGDLDKFHQEYPAYPEQAFLVSGRPVFNVKILSKMRMKAKEPLMTGYLRLEDDQNPKTSPLTFERNDRGYLRVYQKPIKGRNYVIGGDAMKGKIKNESKKEPDKCSLQVLDVRTLEQVATWEGRIDADLFGIEVVKVARYFNDAFVGIELNDGVATVARIKQIGYWNIYCRTSVDKLMDVPTNQLGWWTDAKSKLLMMGELAKYIREWLGDINDKQTISELMSYVYDDDGSMNAVEGCHDDHVVSYAIAYQMCKHYWDSPDPVTKPEDIPGSFAWWEQRIKEQQDKPVMI